MGRPLGVFTPHRRLDEALLAGVESLGGSNLVVIERDLDQIEVRVEHPELPGVFIFPVDAWVDMTIKDDDLVVIIIERLAAAVAEERNVPYGD